MPPKRRGDKRERTRARLIEAAGEVIAEKGIDRMALEDVAQRAGMSRGAIYGNFRDKEELLLAVAATRWRPIVSSSVTGGSLAERMKNHGLAVAAAAPARRAEAVGATSFVQYALTHEHLRVMVSATNEQIYRMSAARLSESVPPQELPASADVFVRVVHALTEGLLVLHALTPDLITPEVIEQAFSLLAPKPAASPGGGARAKRSRSA